MPSSARNARNTRNARNVEGKCDTREMSGFQLDYIVAADGSRARGFAVNYFFTDCSQDKE